MTRRNEAPTERSDTPVLRQDLIEDLEWSVGELYGLSLEEMKRIEAQWGRHAF